MEYLSKYVTSTHTKPQFTSQICERSAITTELCDPEPDLLSDISWVSFWPCLILSVECRLSGGDISIDCLYNLSLFENLPEKVKGKENWDANISDQEVVDKPIPVCKDGETVEKDDDSKETNGKICKVWL